MMSSADTIAPRTPDWLTWQRAVVSALRRELAEIESTIELSDVDWAAWERYFRQGLTPEAAIDRALERGL